MKAPVSSGRSWAREPLNARPIGVRTVSTMTASGTAASLGMGLSRSGRRDGSAPALRRARGCFLPSMVRTASSGGDCGRLVYARAMSDEATGASTGLNPAQAAEMLSSSEVQLIDVRQDFEWQEGRIEGSVHIPLDVLPARAGEIDRERPVIFACRSGARSAMATDAFRASGIEAFNLEGGLEAWVADGLELDRAAAQVALPRPDNS